MRETTAGAWRKYFYDGLQVVAEGAGTADKIFYTHAPSAVGGIVCRDANGTKYWYHYDHIGNVVAVTDANGDPVVSYCMEAFGGVVAVGAGGGFYYSASDVQPYHLTTKEYDGDVGLYYFNARWYDPATGRFVSKDPVLKAGEDAYCYAYNSPIRLTDPTGAATQLCCRPAAYGLGAFGYKHCWVEVNGSIYNPQPSDELLGWQWTATPGSVKTCVNICCERKPKPPEWVGAPRLAPLQAPWLISKSTLASSFILRILCQKLGCHGKTVRI